MEFRMTVLLGALMQLICMCNSLGLWREDNSKMLENSPLWSKIRYHKDVIGTKRSGTEEEEEEMQADGPSPIDCGQDGSLCDTPSLDEANSGSWLDWFEGWGKRSDSSQLTAAGWGKRSSSGSSKESRLNKLQCTALSDRIDYHYQQLMKYKEEVEKLECSGWRDEEFTK